MIIKKRKLFVSVFSLVVSMTGIFCSEFSSAVDRYIDSLDDVQKISQMFLVNIEGNKTYRSAEFLPDGTPVVPGGVLLFSYNIAETPKEIMEFTSSVEKYCVENNITNAYVAIDQEGGNVNRLREITSRLPSNQKVAEHYSPEQAGGLYSIQAKQMRVLGINMNLAPVIEPVIDSNRGFLGNRSFGNAPASIAYSMKCIAAYEKNGVATVVKHFPGNTNTDPHTGLPVINLSDSDFEMYCLVPFAFAMTQDPSAILMSHTIVKGKDEKSPACLSFYWINDVLKDTLGYEGLVVSDDIFMGALADYGYPPEVAVVQAVKAGTDILMLSEKKFLYAVQMLIEKKSKDKTIEEKINHAVKRIIEFKLKKGVLSIDTSGNIQNKSVLSGKSIEERLDVFYSAKKNGDEL